MLKKYPFLKWSLVSLVTVITLFVSFGFWFMSLLPSSGTASLLKNTKPEDLPYLSQLDMSSKGKVLAVVSNGGIIEKTQKKTGYELTELARPYYVFQANGFEVDVASPRGGKPKVIIDKDDMGAYDFAFLNDAVAQQKANHTIPIDSIKAEDYVAIYFAGGKGALFDFPENEKIQELVREFHQSNKVIGAVCHGPAALVNVTLDDGSMFLKNKIVSGFTNAEELFLIPDAKTIFPFMLQSKMEERGSQFRAGHLYLENVCVDGNLVTGQNPWSTWAFSETMIKRLGNTLVQRPKTAEENTIDILLAYETLGYEEAKDKGQKMLFNAQAPIDKKLLAMHVIVAAMQWEIIKAFDMVCLLSFLK